MLRANPLPVQGSQRKLYSPCWLNGRRYLLPESKPYTPICLGFSPILFPDLQEFSLNQQSTSAEIKAALLKACRIATSEYLKVKNSKSIMPQCIAVMEEIAYTTRHVDKHQNAEG